MATRKPLIAVVADRRILGPHAFHCAGEKYLTAVIEAAQLPAVIVPSLGNGAYLHDALAQVDGVLLPGSPSNIEPQHYGADPNSHVGIRDSHRDGTTLPLIPELIERGTPLLAICRGFQELNVAFGGSLWPSVHEVAGLQDHRENEKDDLDDQYGFAHEVRLVRNGFLQDLAGTDRIRVNSLHGQGIRQLAPGLVAEAYAPDGLIEAARVLAAYSFAVGIQWHPEWKVNDNSFSRALFQAFAAAARAHAAERQY